MNNVVMNALPTLHSLPSSPGGRVTVGTRWGDRAAGLLRAQLRGDEEPESGKIPGVQGDGGPKPEALQHLGAQELGPSHSSTSGLVVDRGQQPYGVAVRLCQESLE